MLASSLYPKHSKSTITRRMIRRQWHRCRDVTGEYCYRSLPTAALVRSCLLGILSCFPFLTIPSSLDFSPLLIPVAINTTLTRYIISLIGQIRFIRNAFFDRYFARRQCQRRFLCVVSRHPGSGSTEWRSYSGHVCFGRV